MISPYKAKLTGFVGMENMITIQRADAPDVVGQIKNVDDFGVTILQAYSDKQDDGRLKLFIAFEDIRGVGEIVSEPV